MSHLQGQRFSLRLKYQLQHETPLDKRRVPYGWPACLRRQPPRVAFRNNDIYVVEDEDCKEPRERHPKV